VERTGDSHLIEWLRDRASVGDEVVGFDAVGWETSIWILHAMYEHERRPAREVGPGPGRDRVRWGELASRLDVDPFAGVPGPGSFPRRPRWPEMLVEPPEGDLNPWELDRLVRHLAGASPAGGDARCLVFYAMLAASKYDELVIYTCRLNELVGLVDTAVEPCGPSNIWPEDRSWLVYTNYDLWGTKVSGSAELIASLSADTELETVALDV
jgi:hypothetical protein